MELDEIKELMGLLKETDVTEIQIEKEGIKLKIKREKNGVQADVPQVTVVPPRNEPVAAQGEAEVPERPQHVVPAPIVGTFYRAPAPDAAPFVEVGSRIKKGQILCIIEAMKLMNEIESDAEGVITKILVENGKPVEYGQALFVVEPA
ncbi:MAG: acetyl-CoA carboxylase biotin carboxyl carrier protein [Nitrospiraceae bacterium]|jgi:acetyl-CoA carboxylase biotin carboxyl carrier protein|nr:acetyl-CoA carboxylase biotin carboxyl carrier protein [Nitrospiraceae bacterium]